MTLKHRFALRCPLAGAALLSAAPAFAANLPKFDLAFTRSDYALGALLVVLLASLAVSLSRDHREPTETMADGPDMRWWRNAHL